MTELAPDRLDALLRVAAEAWRDFTTSRIGAFHHFIPADQREVYEKLRSLRGSANSFLELGSGVGVITVFADLLGFDAYGIEIEPALIQSSLDMAQEFESGATFIEGSFVPPSYRDDIAQLDGDFLTVTEGADAYEELGMEINDFDLVYAYPWPGEEEWMTELVRQNAGPHTTLLTYSGTEGFELVKFD